MNFGAHRDSGKPVVGLDQTMSIFHRPGDSGEFPGSGDEGTPSDVALAVNREHDLIAIVVGERAAARGMTCSSGDLLQRNAVGAHVVEYGPAVVVERNACLLRN